MEHLKLVVRYAETDKMGIVHHANYFIWFEAARSFIIKKIGLSYADIENKYGLYLPIISCDCSIRKPNYYDKEVIVKCIIKELIGTRIKFYYEVINEENQLTAYGNTEHVFVNKEFKPINIKKKLPDIYNKLLELKLSVLF